MDGFVGVCSMYTLHTLEQVHIVMEQSYVLSPLSLI